MKMVRSSIALAAIALSFMPSAMYAQQSSSPIGQGSWIVDPSAALGRRHDDLGGGTETFVRLGTDALTFVQPHFAIGGSGEIGYSKAGRNHTRTFGIGPAARYYFGELGGTTFPFVSGSVVPRWIRAHYTAILVAGNPPAPVDFDFDERDITIDTSVGLTQILVPHVGATGEAYFTHHDIHADATPASTATNRGTNEFGLRFGLTIFLYR